MPRRNAVLSSSSESDTEEYEPNKQGEQTTTKRKRHLEHTAQYYPQRVTRSMSKQRQFPQQQTPSRPAQQAMREKSRSPNAALRKQFAVRSRTPNQNSSRASMEKQQAPTLNQRGRSKDPQQKARSRSPGTQNSYTDGANQLKSKIFTLPSFEELEKACRKQDEWVKNMNNEIDKIMESVERASR